MRSEPVKRIKCLLLGGPGDGQMWDMPVTASGMPAPFITYPMVLPIPGGQFRRAIPYRLERAQQMGTHSEASFRYVCIVGDAPMPDHDWDEILVSLEIGRGDGESREP